jgi:hypothetical protein
MNTKFLIVSDIKINWDQTLPLINQISLKRNIFNPSDPVMSCERNNSHADFDCMEIIIMDEAANLPEMFVSKLVAAFHPKW